MSFGSKSLPPPTADEQRRMDKIKARGCMFTGLMGEIHHLLSGGLRIGHRYTVCLNPYLHRGVTWGTLTLAECKKQFGPSLALNRREFANLYGDDQWLLDQQDILVGWNRAEIPTKRRRGKTAATSKTFQHPSKR